MTKITGFVLRCLDRKKTAEFYAKLGLTTTEHEHGGPLHFTVQPLTEEMVVEIYNASSLYPKDAIMLMVDSIEMALAVVKDFGIIPKTSVLTGKNLRCIYITDPDGRDVMLIQK